MAKIVSNVVAVSVKDKQTGDHKYNVYNFKDDEGNMYEKVFKVPQGFKDGMEVDITSAKGKFGTEYTVTEVGGSTKSAGGGSSSGKQSDAYWAEKDLKIGRMAAINSALEFVGIAVKAGGFTDKVIGDPDLLLATVFQYANLIENAAADASVFKNMPTFTGDINAAEESPQ